jgi:hypothetical protein
MQRPVRVAHEQTTSLRCPRLHDKHAHWTDSDEGLFPPSGRLEELRPLLRHISVSRSRGGIGAFGLVLALAAVLVQVARAGPVFPGSGASATPTTAPAGVPTVPCSNIAGTQSGPHANGNRLVLGVISAPPAYVGRSRTSSESQWPFRTRSGIAMRAAGEAVTVSVPAAQRGRVAIRWGGTGPVFALRFEPCTPPRNTWNGYAGGFLLRSRSACVPLVFTVGSQKAVVRFGIGRQCPARG